MSMKTDIRIELPDAKTIWLDRYRSIVDLEEHLLDTFNELEMAYPKTTAKRRRELKTIRKQL